MNTTHQMQNPTVTSYIYAPDAKRSAAFQVRIDGVQQHVGETSSSAFLCAAWQGAVTVEVECNAPIASAIVRPRSRQIAVVIENNIARFALENPCNLSIEIEGQKPLFLFAAEIDENKPAPDDENVHYFRAGAIHEIGELNLQSDQTLYIEGGAIVRGCVTATNAKNVRIAGHGILDGSVYNRQTGIHFSIALQGCQNVRVQDIVMIEPSSWMLVVGGCRDVEIENVHQIGEVISSDGIDIVGSKNVRVRNCMQRNNDDCVVLKSVSYNDKTSKDRVDWRSDVENIVVEGCIFLNDRGGNAIEIGYETQCDSMRDITFRDCDVLSVHGLGAAFSIHNGDRATISDVLFENIRVEHFYDKLVDLRVLDSSYRKDQAFGRIHNITFRNIRVLVQTFNVGYSHSIIGGFDAQHKIENVRFEDFYLNEIKVTNADVLDLYLKQAENIEFC